MPTLEARISTGAEAGVKAHSIWTSIVARLQPVHLGIKERHGGAVRVGFSGDTYAIEVRPDGTLRAIVNGTWVIGFPTGNTDAEYVEAYLKEVLPDVRSYIALRAGASA